MTSCPVGNKISLSRKPWIPDKKLLWNAIRKSRSLFQNPSWKIACSALGIEITMTSYLTRKKTLVISETMHLWLTVARDHYQEVMVALSESVMKSSLSAPWQRNHDDVISGLQWNLVISETMHPRRNVDMERYQEVMVARSESVMKIRRKPPLAEKSRWCHIRLAKKLVISETMHPRWKVGKKRYKEVMVALSESVMKICRKRILAEKSRRRHIRLAMKPRYLGNHASQIKSYFESLSGSHARFFRMRPE